MIRTILSLALLTSLAMASPLKADPPPKSKKKKQQTTTPKVVPATPGWSLVNGVWTHSDGYQFIKGQVVRAGAQTHKKAPPPPTKAEMDAATKKKPAARPPAEIAAEKAAQRERNLTPRAASQTGSHL